MRHTIQMGVLNTRREQVLRSCVDFVLLSLQLGEVRPVTSTPTPPHVKVGFCERTSVTSSPGAPTLHGPFPGSPSLYTSVVR